jgi:hypothetical protein
MDGWVCMQMRPACPYSRDTDLGYKVQHCLLVPRYMCLYCSCYGGMKRITVNVSHCVCYIRLGVGLNRSPFAAGG